MSRRYRRYVIAACGWLILSAQAPQPKAEAENRQAAANAKQPTPPLPVRVVGPVKTQESAQASEYENPCRKGSDNRDSDLCAQWKAADAARDAADYARQQLLIAAFGIAGLILTLWLTYGALNATRAGVDLAADTAKRQLRAYISADKIQALGFRPGGQQALGVLIKNSGQTPAYGVRVISRRQFSNMGPDRFRFRFGEREEGFSYADLGPGQDFAHINRHDEPMAPELYDAIVGGEIVLIFAGVIVYRDAFKKRHITMFRYYLGHRDMDWKKGTGFLLACAKGSRSN